jgi:hypothetical protein
MRVHFSLAQAFTPGTRNGPIGFSPPSGGHFRDRRIIIAFGCFQQLRYAAGGVMPLLVVNIASDLADLVFAQRQNPVALLPLEPEFRLSFIVHAVGGSPFGLSDETRHA